jgi:peptidoglycan/xylan/chitin deacetylase (PgdA/CDA1 family)
LQAGSVVGMTPHAESAGTLKVFFTVDVEIWCDGWHDLDTKFKSAFDAYVYGKTRKGAYGLPYQLRVLKEHGLSAVFFVEPLFAARFGLEPLVEIVGMIQDAGQEVQLHLHTEWVDEARAPLLPNVRTKRQFLREFSLDEQTTLIAVGRDLLRKAGAPSASAFRAGGFGFNTDTLRALACNGIPFDSSYNASLRGPESGVLPGDALVDVFHREGVYEYPMTVFHDGTGALRHVQLTSCSYAEIEGVLWHALTSGTEAFVILSHNFELLNPTKTRADDVVVRRFHRLCSFLDRHRDRFPTCGFSGLRPSVPARRSQPLRSSRWKTAVRMAEQLYRRRYG